LKKTALLHMYTMCEHAVCYFCMLKAFSQFTILTLQNMSYDYLICYVVEID